MKPSVFSTVLIITTVFSCRAPTEFDQNSRIGSVSSASLTQATLPESDIPPSGRSLFDQITATPQGDHLSQVVPYPFTALVSKLGATTDTAPVKVLFPGGRSLERNAAGDQKFAKPRIVLAMTGNPVAADPELLLKNRLYVGFSEAANQLEVISYNDASGRFEFQIVENYGPNLTPDVKYVSRRFCEACHQNAAPIFRPHRGRRPTPPQPSVRSCNRPCPVPRTISAYPWPQSAMCPTPST